ncbi:unnamed protein product [Mytilus edulis]|uniref:Uncharacterized protein n=1 Tax=Mytilus edulis TaxID=6550 RepID=A0A8S3VLB7_MYTED|nr:unnamed protein product [Mytilus edulis]
MGEIETICEKKLTEVQRFRQKVENQMVDVLEKLGLLQVTKDEDENPINELQKTEESFETKDTENFQKLHEGIPKAISIVRGIKFEKKGKYETSIPFINSITSDEEGKIWIADGDQCIQQLEIKDGVNALKSYTIERDLEELRCLNKNKIYFTSSTQILCLIRKKDIKILKDFAPNKVFTIHISRDNEIIVGMNLLETERTDVQPVLIRIDFDGKIIQVYKNQGRQLLTRDIVRCCTTLKDGTICYLDTPFNYRKEKAPGSVVNIDNNGTIQWKYSGNSFINSVELAFFPN